MGFAGKGKQASAARKGKGEATQQDSANPCKSFTQDLTRNGGAETDSDSDSEESEVLSEHKEFDNVEEDWQSECDDEGVKDLFSDEVFVNVQQCLSHLEKEHCFRFEDVKTAFVEKYSAATSSSDTGADREAESAEYSMYQHMRVVNYLRIKGPLAMKKELTTSTVEGKVDYEKLFFAKTEMWSDDCYLCPVMSADPLLEYWSYFESEDWSEDEAPVICGNVIMEMVPEKAQTKAAELDPEVLEAIRREGGC